MEQCQFCNNMFGDTKMLKQHQKKTKYCLKIQEAQAKAKKVETIKLQETISELTCQFCSKQFKTKYLLRIHQTQAKYCLKIQESQNSEAITSCLVTCKFCNKNFSALTFNRHDVTCKKKNQFLLNQKDEEITKMKIEKAEEISLIYKATAERAQATIEEIAKQPTYQKISTRNIQNNLMISSLTPLDLSQARVDSIIDEKYTKNDFYGGQKAAAQVVYKCITTDSNGKSQIVCTDTERGTFHHIDVNGEHVVDYKNRDLIEKVHLPLKRKACEFAAEEYVKNPSASKEIIISENSIRELESKPGLFNRTMAQLTGKNCAKQLITETDQPPDLSITEELLENDQLPDLSITEEWLLENAKFLTIEHILRGPEGYADYALSYPLKDRLIIDEEDLEQTFLSFRNSSGEIIIDYGAKMLFKMLFESIRDQIYLLLEEDTKIETVKFDSPVFQKEFTKILLDNVL